MKRVLVSQVPKAGQSLALSDSESLHLLKVLRLSSGDRLQALDGKGATAVVELEIRAKRAFVVLSPDQPKTQLGQPGFKNLDVALSILKADAMSWAVEKLCEVGVRSLRPILTEFTVVKLNKDPKEFQARWQETADQALKQCGRLVRMEILTPQKLEDILLDRTISQWSVLDLEGEKAPLPQALPAALMIGPEGGWSPTERAFLSRDPKCRLIQLSTNTLRAETAAVAAASAVLLN